MGRETTRQRALDMSAELFNTYGIEAASINQISEALGISPGNFTYHFKKKSDLIAAHIAQLEKELVARMDDFPVVSNASTFTRAYLDLMALTLRYRFLFIGANYIIQNDLVPAARYQKLVSTIKGRLERQIEQLTASGHMKPVRKPYTIKMLLDSIWWQWLGWLLVLQITGPARRAPTPKVLGDAVLHILFLNHHYVDEEFFLAVQHELRKLAKSSPSED